MNTTAKIRPLALLLLAAATLCHASDSLLLSNLSYRRFTTIDGLSQMQTESVWQDTLGYIYIGTLSGFARFDGLSLTPFLRGQRENIVAFQQIEGRVRAMGFLRQWVVSGDDTAMTPIDPQGEMLLNNFNAADLPPSFLLLEDRQEQHRTLCHLEGDSVRRVAALPLLNEMTPDRKMYLDSTGIYVPTARGLFVIPSQKQCRRLSDKSDVFSLIRTPGRLYALAADGIYSVERDSLCLLFQHHFEAPDYGLSVRQNRQGQLLIADSHTIWLYHEKSPSPMRQLATGFNLIKALFVDKWNRLWAATYQGAYCFFHCNFVNHQLSDHNDIVRAIAADDDGRLVMGTLNGKVLVDGKMISCHADNFFVPGAITLAGKVYMAGNGDVACVQGDSVQWLALPFDKYQFVSRHVSRLIVATRSSVLAYDPDTRRLDTLTTEILRPWCAVSDTPDRLWVSGNPGLYCLTGLENGGKPAVKKVKSTPTTLVITTMATDGNGRVCFALGDSLFTIRNGGVAPMTETLPVLKGHEIRSLHLSPRGYLVVGAIDGLMVARLTNDCRAADIHWFDARSGFTMIEPLTGTMAETADGTVWLPGLEEMMSFSPEALLADNQQSTVVKAPRPWWQQWWAWLLAAALLSVTLWRVARWFEQRQARNKMERLKREKTQKELQLSTVRLKAIPHFHANVLASIEYFVMNNSADEATHYLKLYSDFTNQTLADIDRPSRSVADEVDYARAYLELEQLRYGERLQYSITVEPQVDQKVMLPTMLFHTYCQNAVKHGIANKAGAGNVTVTVSRERRDGADGVLVAVSDDGIGRSEAAHTGGLSTKQGLKILRQQIELYNRANQHHIVQHVTDLTDASGRPAGTRFETWVPVDYRY